MYIFFLFCISVAGLPTDYDDGSYYGARAVTSASGITNISMNSLVKSVAVPGEFCLTN